MPRDAFYSPHKTWARLLKPKSKPFENKPTKFTESNQALEKSNQTNEAAIHCQDQAHQHRQSTTNAFMFFHEMNFFF